MTYVYFVYLLVSERACSHESRKNGLPLIDVIVRLGWLWPELVSCNLVI